MEKKNTAFDLVVIGSGPAGYVAAIHGAQQGLSVAIVEKDAHFGGTCLHRGCIPTKALLESAHLFEKMQQSEKFGILSSDVALDFKKVQGYKRRIVKTNAGGIKFLFKKNRIQSLQGWGALAGKGAVRVTPDEGEPYEITGAKGIILATGSSCRPLGFIEMNGVTTIDSDDILNLSDVPESLIVLGAGAVGTEFASIFSRFGSKVTLVEVMSHILPIEDREVSEELARVLKKQGIDVLTSAKVEKVRSLKDSVKVAIETEAGATEITASKLLVAAGRQPRTANIGLENTAVQVNDRGFIEVDAYMQTGEKGVYAIGDIIPTAMLAHLGSHEGLLAVDHLLGKPVKPILAERVPNCTYCDPEVASVGLTEQEARNRGYDVKVSKFPFQANGKAKIIGESDGFIKLVGEQKYDEILGVHIIGPKATELITEAVATLNMEMTSEELMHVIHPHPTLSESMGEAAHALFSGSPIHF